MSVWRTAIFLLAATVPVSAAQEYQFLDDEAGLYDRAVDAFDNNNPNELQELHDVIVDNIMGVFDNTHRMRNDDIPNKRAEIQSIKDRIQEIKASNDKKDGMIRGRDETDNEITRVQDEITVIETNMTNLIAQSDPNVFIESTYIQSDIDNLVALKGSKHRDLFEASKKLGFTKLDTCNLYALLNLRSYILPEDFSETIKRQRTEIAALEREYCEELGWASNLDDDRENAVVEEKIQLVRKKIEGYVKFKEDTSQFDFEEIERKLQDRIERARDSLQSIQHDVEKIIQGPVVLDDAAATLRSLKTILDDAKNAIDRSKSTIRLCEHQIRMIESQNSNMSSKIAEQRLVLELQRRQQENYHAANSKDLEKIMHKIHKLNLGLIQANAEVRAAEDKIRGVRESIRTRETTYMGLFAAGSALSYLYFFFLRSRTHH